MKIPLNKYGESFLVAINSDVNIFNGKPEKIENFEFIILDYANRQFRSSVLTKDQACKFAHDIINIIKKDDEDTGN